MSFFPFKKSTPPHSHDSNQPKSEEAMLRLFSSLGDDRHMFLRWVESMQKDGVFGSPIFASKSPWLILNRLICKLLKYNLKPSTDMGQVVHALSNADDDTLKTFAGLLTVMDKNDAWPVLHPFLHKVLAYNLKPSTAVGQIVRGLSSASDAMLETHAKFFREFPRESTDKNFHFVPGYVGASASQLDDLRGIQPFADLVAPTINSPGFLLGYDRLYNLYQFFTQVLESSDGRKLNVIEAGVYQGKTSEFLCRVFSVNPSLIGSFYAVDTFAGHDSKDLPHRQEGVHIEGNFSRTSEEAVKALLAPYPFATVRKGRIQDVAPGLAEPEYHFVHLDMDLYEPTAWALDFFLDRMKSGSVILIDDYGKKSCPGIKKSVEEFLQKNHGVFFRFDTQTAQCVLIRR